MNPEIQKLLQDLKKYIEDAEEVFEGEFGQGRSAQKLIADGSMPEIYGRVLSALENRPLMDSK